jgi:hypothetical protein
MSPRKAPFGVTVPTADLGGELGQVLLVFHYQDALHRFSG